jgi:hypothetical protein
MAQSIYTPPQVEAPTQSSTGRCDHDSVLAELACDGNHTVRYNLARNPATRPDIIAQLARHRDASIRGAVAENPAASPHIFGLLARDPDLGVRDAVVRSPSTPPEILAGLARDLWRYKELAKAWPYYELAEKLCDNPATPPDVLAELAHEVLLKEKQGDELRREWRPKYNLSQDPSTPAHIRARLARELPLFSIALPHYLQSPRRGPPPLPCVSATRCSTEAPTGAGRNPYHGVKRSKLQFERGAGACIVRNIVTTAGSAQEQSQLSAPRAG